MMKKTIEKVQERRSVLPAVEPESETRSVRAALSSTQPVQRFFGTEILRHTPESIDLGRASENGLPLLVNHDDSDLPIGRVRNIALESDGVLRGDLQFSEATGASRDAWELARDGTLSDVSIRYRINDYDVRGDSGEEEYIVTNWSLLEASVVSVPADASVGIGRSHEDEGTTMPDETKEAPAAVPTPQAPTASRKAGRDEGVRAERQRIAEVNAIAANFPDNPAAQDNCRQAIEEGWTVERYKDSLIATFSGNNAEPLAAPAPTQRHISHSVQGGQTSIEKVRAGVTEAFDIAAGNIKGSKAAELARQNEFAGMSTIEVARRCLEIDGHNTRGMSGLDVAGAVLGRYIDPGTANLTTTNFPAILEDVINKALFRGFEEAPVTWNMWCGTDSAADFKAGTRPGLSQFTSLAVVAENAAIADGIVNDKKEAFQVQTYARKFSVTRQTLVNDDLAALASIAARMGQAAGRTVDEQVYAYLESDPAMTEVTTLFDAGNNNTGSGAIDVTNIGNARVAMGKQTDSNGVILGIVPQYMIAPLELEQTMLELSTQNTDPTRVRRDNVYRTLWEPVSTPRLTDANDWYMMGNRGDTINVVFLNGQQSPMMARDEGWSTLAAHWRVVLDFDVMAIDYRAAWKSANV